jgi:hypothetical protein
LEVREANGTTVIATGGTATLTATDDAATVATAVEASWSDGSGDIYITTAPPKTPDEELTVWDDEDRSFRVYIHNAAGGAYSEITLGGTSIDGVTYTLDATVHTGIPTLSEWGLIILTVLLVATGVWMMRRRTSFA